MKIFRDTRANKYCDTTIWLDYDNLHNLHPGIVSAESSLCATIHWGSACVLSICSLPQPSSKAHTLKRGGANILCKRVGPNVLNNLPQNTFLIPCKRLKSLPQRTFSIPYTRLKRLHQWTVLIPCKRLLKSSSEDFFNPMQKIEKSASEDFFDPMYKI